MYKRVERRTDSDCSIPAKRTKYDTKPEISVPKSTERKEDKNKKPAKCDDVWGDDFAEADIEEMDFIASQACLEDDNNKMALTQTRRVEDVFTFNSGPSTSRNPSSLSSKETKESGKSQFVQPFSLNKHTIIGQRADISMISQVNYKDFESKLMNNHAHNSTFQTGDNIISQETGSLHELEKLRSENKKLLNDFKTKDGEVVFLRNQLQQTKLRAENEKAEKARFLEEQADRYRSEISAMCKEKEQLKTQLDLQTFEVGNLLERCKLLENKGIKLIEPHAVDLNFSITKSKQHISLTRLSNSVKPAKIKETCVQTSTDNKNSFLLKTWSPYYPLVTIPKLVYDVPQPEKPVVDIHIVEKTGRRNLPILQEEDTFKIFEYPDLVKPLTTMVDGRKLTTEFILSEVAELQRKTNLELESQNSIPLINKIVFTARELILNATVVLQTISQSIRNDDLRDMNDIYFSDLYSNLNLHAKSVCDANAWHDGERGVETRRVLGVMSYIALRSSYLSKYIAGQTGLLIEQDDCYNTCSKQMIRYNTWPKHGHEFEMFEMLLDFVSLVGTTRRCHQFSGVICAIAFIIYNVFRKIEYCSKGMEYVFRIFTEIVFSRPLPYCYVPVTNMMTIFMKSTTHLRKLCANSKTMAVKNWKGALHFTTDACALQIFLAQMENHQSDLIAVIDITRASLQIVQYILQTNVIPLRNESSDSCNCCMKLLRFTIKSLCVCSEVNLSTLEDDQASRDPSSNEMCILKKICPKHGRSHSQARSVCLREIYEDKFADVNFWTTIKRKQMKVFRDGIRFLCHLAICDPDFVIRLSDIEDAFHLFMRNISMFENFVLQQNELEAMDRIKQTFIFDKAPQSDVQMVQSNPIVDQLNILKNFEKRTIKPSSRDSKSNENCDRTLIAIKKLYSSQ